MASRPLFTTLLYEARLDDPAFVAELQAACLSLAETDEEGRRLARAAHFSGYRGYTSFGSLNDLPARDARFAELARRLKSHVAKFAEDCAFELDGRPLKLNGLWVNLLKPGGAHRAHIHPRSVLSGTVYVAIPPGSGLLKFEDPRLPMMMAAPPRRQGAPETLRPFVYAQVAPGSIFMWESWLRHEVGLNTGAEDRISISFNYH